MSHNHGLARRAFLKSAGLTALAGAGAATPLLGASFGDTVQRDTGKFDFDTVYDRIGTNCQKWDRILNQYGKGSIDVGMGVADLDFTVPPCVTKALHDRTSHENWGYIDTTRPYIDAVVAWNKKRYGLDVKPETVVLSTGVHPALIAAIATFSPPGSKVLMTTPVYSGFYSDLTFTRTKAEESPMRLVNGRYEIDFEDFERRISHDTNTFILCNPHNPTGNCWSAEDMTRLGEICLRRRVVVLADEIHCDFVNKGQKYTPFASLPNKEIVNNSITFKAASKSFGLAAMKTAWFFSDNADYMARVRLNHRADLSTLGLVANGAAYTPEGEAWLNQLNDYIDGNHALVESYVRANIPLMKYTKAQGTYLAWLDVTDLAAKLDTKRMAEEQNAKNPSGPRVTPETMLERWLVKNARVHLNQGRSYGLGGDNHMRMNIGTHRKLIELALKNIATAVRNT